MALACLAALILSLAPGAVCGIEAENSDRLSLLQHTLVIGSPAHSAPARKADTWPKYIEIGTPAMNKGYYSPGGPLQNETPPKLVVDLGAAPEHRWQNVTRHYKSLGVFPDCCSTPAADLARISLLLERVPVHETYRRELEGIVADVGHPDVTLESLLVLSIAYELTGLMECPESTVAETVRALLGGEPFPSQQNRAGGCSDILAAKPDGTVVHGRNLDYYGFEMDVHGRKLHWPDVCVEVLFVRNGMPVMTGIQQPGFIGVHTAMRFGGWSFAQNTRMHGVNADILYGLLHHSEGFLFRARRIMESTSDFETAVQKLYSSNMMAPQYFILAGAGPYEGAVLTMDRGGKHLQGKGTPPLLRLSKSAAPSDGEQKYVGWHLVQTNDDHYELPHDLRRPLESLRLAFSTQDVVSTEWMYRELTGVGLFNSGTIFSSVYVPATDYSQTFVHPNNWR